MDTGTLVDIFRDDPSSRLLGTDALRDGVDVPGHSLRCVVMAPVPWPQPSLPHRARRPAKACCTHDARIIRAQAATALGRPTRPGQHYSHLAASAPDLQTPVL